MYFIHQILTIVLFNFHDMSWFDISLHPYLCIPWQQSHSEASDWSLRVLEKKNKKKTHIGCSIALAWLRVLSSLNSGVLHCFSLLRSLLKRSDVRLLWLRPVSSVSCKHHFIWSDTRSHYHSLLPHYSEQGMKQTERMDGGRRRVQKKWRRIRSRSWWWEGYGRVRKAGSWDHKTLAVLSFFIYQSAPCFCFIFSSLEIVLLPLAANADEDNEDGDHKGRRCCDGSQEQ